MKKWLTVAAMPRFLRFVFVGAVGFLVDVGVVYAAIFWLGSGIYISRLISYLTAATATWFMNRHITFADRRSSLLAAEWSRFVLANSIGGAINYGTYALYMSQVHFAGSRPLVGVALGSVAGLFVNYSLSKIFVFSGRRSPTGSRP